MDEDGSIKEYGKKRAICDASWSQPLA
jgi:hypothetical protein